MKMSEHMYMQGKGNIYIYISLLTNFKETPFILSAKNILISVVYSWVAMQSQKKKDYKILIYATRRNRSKHELHFAYEYYRSQD
jgi:hypothetical protein